MLKHIPAVAVFMVSATTGAHASPADQADIAWIASGEFCEPETVLPLPDDTLLVSNVCDFRKRGNGFLTLLDANGKVLDWHAVEGLDAPLGMALNGRRLFVVDNNQVKIFRWPGYEPLETIALDTTVANDIAVSDGGTVYVTDTAEHKVIQFNPGGEQSMLTDEPGFAGANGIEIHGEQLYVGGEELWRVDLQSGAVEVISPDWLEDIDGIEFEADGTMQITPVAGPLVRFYTNGDIEIIGGDGISSANHGYSNSLGLALIPTGFDNTVIAIRVDDD